MERKIRVITKEMDGEAAYEGILHSFNKAAGEIVLSKVTCGNGQKLHSLQHFFKREIIDIQEIGPPSTATTSFVASPSTNVGKKTEAKLPSTPLPEEKPPTKQEQRDLSDDGVPLINREPVEPELYLSGAQSQKQGSISTLNEPPKLTYIETMGLEFKAAIKEINSQRVIGIAAEGCNISRFGTVSLFIVGCRSFTYVFDVNVLGKDCFTNGLGSVLADENILKVIHDCRLLSDYLFHLQLIVLRNIFDTQVAHTIITKADKGELPMSVIPLVPCYYEYLNLATKRCQFEGVKREFVMNNRLIWNERPLPPDLICAAAEQVVYLRELRLAQMERLMSEFLFGVDVYLSCVRDATDQGAGQLGKLNRLPKEFQQLPVLHKQRIAQHHRKGFQGPQIERHKNTENQRIDGVWLEGNQFSTSYEQRHGKVVEYAGQKPSLDSLHLAPVKRHFSPETSPLPERKSTTITQNEKAGPLRKSKEDPEHEEYPPLSASSSTFIPKKQVSAFDSPPEPNKPSGRGKIRDYYLQIASDAKPPGMISPNHSLLNGGGGGRQSLPIPDDEELLASSYIVNVDESVHVPGEEIIIKKRVAHDHI